MEMLPSPLSSLFFSSIEQLPWSCDVAATIADGADRLEDDVSTGELLEQVLTVHPSGVMVPTLVRLGAGLVSRFVTGVDEPVSVAACMVADAAAAAFAVPDSGPLRDVAILLVSDLDPVDDGVVDRVERHLLTDKGAGFAVDLTLLVWWASFVIADVEQVEPFGLPIRWLAGLSSDRLPDGWV